MTSDPGGWVEVDLGPGVRAAFTTAPDNLSLELGDDRAAVLGRRTALAARFGAPVAYVRQVHGAAVQVCAEPPRAADPVAAADALASASVEVALAVLVADCVPVLLADPAAGVVAAVHAGRRGLVAGVVAAAVEAMVSLGAEPAAVRAVLGPAVCGACYEVPAALRDEVAAAVPGTASTTSWGTPALDLPSGVRSRLAEAGIGSVVDLSVCTLTDSRWFSHRGSATSERPPGRFAGVVRLLPRR